MAHRSSGPSLVSTVQKVEHFLIHETLLHSRDEAEKVGRG